MAVRRYIILRTEELSAMVLNNSYFLYALPIDDPVLSPGSINGSGIVGRWQGTIQSTTASGVKLEVISPISLSNGQIYFGSKFPTEGLAGVNTQLPPQLNNRGWGTCIFSNGNGAIQIPYGKIPIWKEGNQISLTKNQKDWPFYQLTTVDGATFIGTNNMSSVNGNFTDNGALKKLYHEYNSCLYPAVTPDSGSYQVKDYTILWASLKINIICLTSPLIPLKGRGKGRLLEMPLFNYEDGRKIKLAFQGPGYDLNNKSPATLRMSFNEDPMMKQ